MRRKNPSILGALRHLARDRSGNALVEFSLIAPMFFTVWLGVIELGFIFNNYTTLAAATVAGARQLAIDRGIDTIPYSDTINQIKNSAGFLTTANITTVVTICTSSTVCTTCNTDASCYALLGPSSNPVGAQGYLATVTTSYPCFLPFSTASFLPLASGCKLSAAASNLVQ
jgi:Flp pilus assembly protein TadG